MGQNEFEKTMSAAAFAEAGEHDAAREMASGSESAKKAAPAPAESKPWGKMLIFGAMSLALYLFLFSNEKLVTETYTKGGMFAFWPLGTALIFSFVHGAFASNFLSVLGIEAKK
ncbi:MAG: hypothetical protein OEV64_03430 [Desulfobulbaceae bacterium]|nr:hypothetical protein [Desulfobulbaceae bacterium]